MPERRFLRCDECHTPVAELRGEVLVIKSRHKGQQHVTTISVRWLAEQCGIIAAASHMSNHMHPSPVTERP